MKKSALLSLIGSMFLISPALAQTRLWTWTPTDPANVKVLSTLQSSCLNTEGAAGFAFLEVHQAANETRSVKLRLVWISDKGKVLKDIFIDRPEESVAAATGLETPIGNYKILHVSDQRWVATDGQTVWTSLYRDKVVTTTTHVVADGVDVIACEQPPTFKGWLERESTSSEGTAAEMSGVSLWSVRN